MDQLKETPQTVRQQLFDLLLAGPQGVRELSQQLHQSESEIYAHLLHLDRSARVTGHRLVIEPAICLSCGFVFQHRTRPQPPGRCPRCRATRIRRPRYLLH
ncbi:MAG: transcriptional regulator [Desulfobulbus sp.]|nr:transcriptional regulator [Desulfobulbus sp.]